MTDQREKADDNSMRRLSSGQVSAVLSDKKVENLHALRGQMGHR